MTNKLRSYFGVILMIDALGARGFSIEESRRFLTNRQSFIERLDEKQRQLSQFTELDQKVGEPQIVTFGDTVILAWPLPLDTPDRFLPALAEWVRPAVLVGLQLGFLFRGAIAVGEYILDSSTVLGPALSDAASWYEEADWIGVIATPSCGNLLSRIEARLQGKVDMRRFYVEYDVPLKGGLTSRMWTVSWPAQFPPKRSVDIDGSTINGQTLFFELLSRLMIPKGTEAKYSHTRQFFEWFQNEIGLSVFDQPKETEQKDGPNEDSADAPSS